VTIQILYVLFSNLSDQPNDLDFCLIFIARLF